MIEEVTFPLPEELMESLKTKIAEGNKLLREKNEEKEVEKEDDEDIDSEMDSTILKILGSYVNKQHPSATLENLVSFTSSLMSNTEYGRMIMTDALWFWGTQVAPSTDDSQSESSEEWMRLCSLVRELGSSRILDVTQMKKTLELNLLSESGLWSDKAALEKRLVKINTSLVYRQQKYNLLREESEGYSKLFTVLSSLPSPPSDPSSHIANVFSLIGYFDLDPNRVLDIVLDVMENQLWNGSFLLLLGKFRKTSIEHILGFKFMNYHSKNEEVSSVVEKSSQAKSLASVPFPSSTPRSLYLLAATLITADKISLASLMPYLSPNFKKTGEIVSDENNKLISDVKSYGVVSLSSKSSSDNKAQEASDEKNGADGTEKRPFASGNQILGLTAALILTKNWVVASEMFDLLEEKSGVRAIDCSDVSSAVISLISWSIESIYRPFSMVSMKLAANSTESEPYLPLISMVTTVEAEEVSEASRMDVEDSSLDQELTERQLNGKLFQEISSQGAFVSTLKPLLTALGHHLSKSVVLFTRICRVLHERMVIVRNEHSKQLHGKTVVDEESFSESVEVRDILAILSETLLPSLSRIECNPFAASSLWNVLSLLPFHVRFDIYRLWKGDGFGKQALDKKPVEVCFAEARALHGAKACLKRLSKENTKQMGRMLAKYTHSCPLGLFHHILSQIEVYDNMIPFVVDALRHTTSLGKDVMAFTLLNQLDQDSAKLKPGETQYSGWFSALSKFVGSFYRKYPTTEMFGLLHFLLRKVSTGDSLDLLILKELLGTVGGCDTFLEVSHAQLQGLSGGRALQVEIMKSQAKEPVSKKAVDILREALLKSETALPMLLFIAQSRSNILFGGIETKQLKLVGYLFDTCQDVLMQFSDFLVGSVQSISSGGSGDSPSILDLMPSMDTLVSEIGLSMPVTFQLVRPLMRLALQHGIELHHSKNKQSNEKDNNFCSDEILNQIPSNLRRWHPYSPEIMSLVKSHLPAEVWSSMSVELYVTFWSLSLYDIIVPSSRYEEEVKRLKNRCSNLERSHSSEDRVASRQRRQELSRTTTMISTLKESHEKQLKHVENIHAMLLSQKEQFFNHVSSEELPNIITHIMQHCVHDSQFFLFLHANNTPKLSTIHFLDKTFKTLAPLLFCSTEYEAGFIGFFIHDLLKQCNRWAKSKTHFLNEAHNKSGFETQDQPGGRASYEQFLKIYKIWHTRLRTICVSCLKSAEYMHVRSALRFLTKVAEEYPTRSTAGKAILSCVENVEKGKATADMEGLKVMAKGVGALLKAHSRGWVDDDPSVAQTRDKRSSSALKPSSSSSSLSKEANSTSSNSSSSSSSSSTTKSTSSLSKEANATASSNATKSSSSSSTAPGKGQSGSAKEKDRSSRGHKEPPRSSPADSQEKKSSNSKQETKEDSKPGGGSSSRGKSRSKEGTEDSDKKEQKETEESKKEAPKPSDKPKSETEEQKKEAAKPSKPSTRGKRPRPEDESPQSSSKRPATESSREQEDSKTTSSSPAPTAPKSGASDSTDLSKKTGGKSQSQQQDQKKQHEQKEKQQQQQQDQKDQKEKEQQDRAASSQDTSSRGQGAGSARRGSKEGPGDRAAGRGGGGKGRAGRGRGVEEHKRPRGDSLTGPPAHFQPPPPGPGPPGGGGKGGMRGGNDPQRGHKPPDGFRGDHYRGDDGYRGNGGYGGGRKGQYKGDGGVNNYPHNQNNGGANKRPRR